VRAGDLVVDERAQRTTRPERVAELEERWDWGLAEGITLAQRDDGTLVVTEGQNRVLALQHKNPDIEVWCLLDESVKGLADEATVGLSIAKGRKPHSQTQQWRMRVTAGQPHELAATRILDSLGLRIADGRGAVQISGAGTVMKLIHGTPSHPLSPADGAQLLSKTLSLIQAAIPEDSRNVGRRWDSAIIKAVAHIISVYPEVDTMRLAQKLAERTANQWLAFGQSTTPAWRGVSTVMVGDYNRALRGRRLGQ
jgi:hypothetical protein